MSFTKRNLHYVAPTIQKKIVKKIIFYWGACLVFSALPLIIGTTLGNPNRLFVDHIGDLARRFWPLYVVIMGLLPFAIRDALRMTNRTLGPLTRLGKELEQYKKSGCYNPVICREDDFLREMIENVNHALVGDVSAPEDAELTEAGV